MIGCIFICQRMIKKMIDPVGFRNDKDQQVPIFFGDMLEKSIASLKYLIKVSQELILLLRNKRKIRIEPVIHLF